MDAEIRVKATTSQKVSGLLGTIRCEEEIGHLEPSELGYTDTLTLDSWSPELYRTNTAVLNVLFCGLCFNNARKGILLSL
jgi:hypothetical protein